MPGHFAERHGLIVIIALGESIVAIGAGSEVGVDAGVVAAAVLGITIAAAMWWLYFDVVALVAERKLSRAAPGREQNEMARDSYSYIHLLMVAGIVLSALGLKKTIGDVGEPLKTIPAVAMLGGTALYLLGHVAFRWRNLHTLNRRRLATAILLVALIPLAREISALASVAIVAGLLWHPDRLRGGALCRRARPHPTPAGRRGRDAPSGRAGAGCADEFLKLLGARRRSAGRHARAAGGRTRPRPEAVRAP